jgi:glycine hydroxymethyltransferase
MFTGPLAFADAQIAGLIQSQRAQNEATINLVASESYCPRATLEAEASALINKNASGYPPRRSLGGSDLLDRIENLAVERARGLFGAEHANVQALSSTIANIAVVRAPLPRGGRILSLDPAAGGHGSHGGSRHLSGQDYEVRHFGVVEETGDIDYAAAAEPKKSRSAPSCRPAASAITTSRSFPSWAADSWPASWTRRVSRPEKSQKLPRDIVESAYDRGADMIVTLSIRLLTSASRRSL